MADFLKGLPVYDEQNFTKFQLDTNSKATGKKPSVYICTKDYPAEQVITTEKTSILLRYLHQQWDKKHSNKKRDSNRAGLEEGEVSSTAPKMPRLVQDPSPS